MAGATAANFAGQQAGVLKCLDRFLHRSLEIEHVLLPPVEGRRQPETRANHALCRAFLAWAEGGQELRCKIIHRQPAEPLEFRLSGRLLRDPLLASTEQHAATISPRRTEHKTQLSGDRFGSSPNGQPQRTVPVRATCASSCQSDLIARRYCFGLIWVVSCQVGSVE